MGEILNNFKKTLKTVRKYRLTGMVTRHENRERERSRLYQLRQQLAEGVKDADIDTLK